MHMLSQWLGRIASLLAEVIIDLLAAFLRIRIDLYGDETFFFSPEDGKKPVRSYSLQ